MKHSRIAGTGRCLPKRVVTNDELAQTIETLLAPDGGMDLVSVPLQQDAKRIENRRFVVDDQNPGCTAHEAIVSCEAVDAAPAASSGGSDGR